MRASEFIDEHNSMQSNEFLQEILKKAPVTTTEPLWTQVVNTLHGNHLITGLTTNMTTPNLKSHGVKVLKMVTNNQVAEYHIHNDNADGSDVRIKSGQRLPTEMIDPKVGLEAIAIIYHDAIVELAKGRKVEIMAPSGTRINDYRDKAVKVMKHSGKNYPVSTVYPTVGLDGKNKEAFTIGEQVSQKFAHVQKIIEMMS